MWVTFISSSCLISSLAQVDSLSMVKRIPLIFTARHSLGTFFPDSGSPSWGAQLVGESPCS